MTRDKMLRAIADVLGYLRAHGGTALERDVYRAIAIQGEDREDIHTALILSGHVSAKAGQYEVAHAS